MQNIYRLEDSLVKAAESEASRKDAKEMAEADRKERAAVAKAQKGDK